MKSRLPDLDQLRIFLAVVEEGSFSAAARKLRRAQSVVTYAIQELEADMGVLLFDRSAYRPVLTEAGQALLPRARRVWREAVALQGQAQGIADGLEAELTLVVDPMYPMGTLTGGLARFRATFPSVRMRLHVEALGAAVDMVAQGEAELGLVITLFAALDRFERRDGVTIAIVPVCTPDHSLAVLQSEVGRVLSGDDVRDHLQIVLSDRSTRTSDEDQGVAAMETWRVRDLGAKHAMLRAGLGWGSLPRHIVADDLAAGRLVELALASWAPTQELQTALVRPVDRTLGPAGRWLFDHLVPQRPGA
jgi:DNA-binding transcriptional LysR family regulator